MSNFMNEWNMYNVCVCIFFVDYIIFVFKEKDYEIIRFISFWFIVFNKIYIVWKFELFLLLLVNL